MSMTLNPYFAFPDGTARAAMEFYRDVFGGELALTTFGQMGDTGPERDNIMHARLETPQGFVLMASDTHEGMELDAGTTISISLSGDDEALRGFWSALSEGGTVQMPMERQVWGDEYGQCTDKFGTSWMVNLASSAE